MQCNGNFKQWFNIFLIISEAWQGYESKAYGVSNHNLKLQSKKLSRTRDIPNFPTQGWADTAFCTHKRSETYEFSGSLVPSLPLPSQLTKISGSACIGNQRQTSSTLFLLVCLRRKLLKSLKLRQISIMNHAQLSRALNSWNLRLTYSATCNYSMHLIFCRLIHKCRLIKQRTMYYHTLSNSGISR